MHTHSLPVGDGRGDRPQVSVLTPTRLLPERIGFLLELHADLLAADVDYEWIVAVDGEPGRIVPTSIVDDPHARIIRTGRPVGAAAARNLALGLARAAYITSADDDDRLPPGSLTARLRALVAGDAGWTAGRLADLQGGRMTPIPTPIAPGPVDPGGVWRAWGCPCQRFPLGPTTLMVRARLLRSVGGWQGLPQAEDLGMTLSVTGRSRGVMLDQVVYAYRSHHRQMTRGSTFQQLEPLVRHIAYERGRIIAGAPATSQPEVAPTA